ncbi:unnamed protein product, partial [Musa textilis]
FGARRRADVERSPDGPALGQGTPSRGSLGRSLPSRRVENGGPRPDRGALLALVQRPGAAPS